MKFIEQTFNHFLRNLTNKCLFFRANVPLNNVHNFTINRCRVYYFVTSVWHNKQVQLNCVQCIASIIIIIACFLTYQFDLKIVSLLNSKVYIAPYVCELWMELRRCFWHLIVVPVTAFYWQPAQWWVYDDRSSIFTSAVNWKSLNNYTATVAL